MKSASFLKYTSKWTANRAGWQIPNILLVNIKLFCQYKFHCRYELPISLNSLISMLIARPCVKKTIKWLPASRRWKTSQNRTHEMWPTTQENNKTSKLLLCMRVSAYISTKTCTQWLCKALIMWTVTKEGCVGEDHKMSYSTLREDDRIFSSVPWKQVSAENQPSSTEETQNEVNSHRKFLTLSNLSNI